MKKVTNEKEINFIFKAERDITESFIFIEKILKKYNKKIKS